jgi:4'-phosphopantetheinyl transferase EntD
VTSDLIAAFERLAGPDVAVAVRTVARQTGPLWPAEQLAMARAVPARLAEFTAGRTAARAALRLIGLADTAIPVGPDRAPVWPQGIVGSITHANQVCVAMVARAGAIKGIGVDLELSDPLPADLWPAVFTAAEIANLDRMTETIRGQTAKLFFSAKECAYKCIYPQIQRVMDFSALQIRQDSVDQNFGATLMYQAGPFAAGTTWHGRYALLDQFVATVMVLR